MDGIAAQCTRTFRFLRSLFELLCIALHWALLIMAMAVGIVTTAAAISPASPRPDPADVPAMARWLVSQNDWGVLSTISMHLGGTPWGRNSFLYLSKMDPTPKDIDSDPRSSFTLSEAPLGTCGGVDTEISTCARLTLSGRVKEITDKQELDFALALFSKHPEMPDWPKGHKWVFTS